MIQEAIQGKAGVELSPKTQKWLAIVGSGFLVFLIYLTTVQAIPNGSPHPYTTDVGEIQNALPRWGTLHFPGYPLYSLTGSVFTTVLRPFGIEPALGTSLFSTLWGAVGVSLLTALALSFSVQPVAAAATAVLYGLATSVWMDSSLAEVHTMTVALLLASVIFAVQFGRTGKRGTLLWLTLFSTQAVLHQRALIFAAPGLLILILPYLRMILRNIMLVVGVALGSALIYLYLPIRDWMGATWTFNAPGSWQGFWSLLLDTKADRIIDAPGSAVEIGDRFMALRDVLVHDWPLALLAAGLLGLVLGGFWKGWREAGSLLMIALVFPLLTIIIWIGRIGDAALAVNLPTYAMAAVGLAFISAFLFNRMRILGILSVLLWIGLSIYLLVDHRDRILEVTRDPSANEIILLADSVKPNNDDGPFTFMALWGRDFWALAYAKEYQDKLKDFQLVDHNADLESIFDEQGKLLTLSDTFYLWPLDSWIDRLGPVYLSLAGPGVVEISKKPPRTSTQSTPAFKLGNGVSINSVALDWITPTELLLTVVWEKTDAVADNYSVAVHLVAVDPPLGPQDIIAQADQVNPVEGWYPVSRWRVGEGVRDMYKLEMPEGVNPLAVRIAMYQIGDDGQFQTTDWLSLPVPPYPDGAGDS
ncbi:MAG: hypothetical protein ACK2T3_09925 [Candidatus Promineifilaceae bacterium]